MPCVLGAFRPAGADEYGFRASAAPAWSPSDSSAQSVDPWSCLRGCDQDSSCLAVFMTKLAGAWNCWLIEGGMGLGYTAGSIKVQPTQINAFFWGWSAAATNSTGVSHLRDCPAADAPPDLRVAVHCPVSSLQQQLYMLSCVAAVTCTANAATSAC